MRKFFVLFCLASFILSCSQETNLEADYNVIPLPQTIETQEGAPFVMSDQTIISYPQQDVDLKRVADFLSDYLFYSIGKKLLVKEDSKDTHTNSIIIKSTLENSNKEAYELTVTDKQIIINGASASGAFYGVQTLRKSVGAGSENAIVTFSPIRIIDYPRFGYRGSHLDVARHMFPVAFIKEYIDILALHNINKFHWHLTDDQGWRIEMKTMPKLTELGSTRKETVIGRNTGKYDGKEYGGFYTQEEIKDIVAYAADRFITIIPEVDLPGHMLGALKAYPELGCTGGPYEVWTQWGVSEDILCAGNDDVYTFIEKVLVEVMELFPSEFIHIGGDEAPKVRWENCPKCQAKIKALGLQDDKEHTAEEKLQNHVISYVEKFLQGKGRKIIGWDEILEGGLAPNATVMSWRGIDGGVQTAKLGNDVIMTPNNYLYFDYYQTTETDKVPLAIGGYVPLAKVYSFDPIPEALTAEEGRHILGVQANLWTEYISSSDHVLYMLLPRLDALSEIQWTMPAKKNYADFTKRLMRMISLYDKKGYTYSTSAFDVMPVLTANKDKNVIEVELYTIDDAPIYYTLDGSEPTEQSTPYKEKIEVGENLTLKAIGIRPNMKTATMEKELTVNKATMKPISITPAPEGQYVFDGIVTLVDGVSGNRGGFRDGTWIGFNNLGAVEAVIDMEEETEISKVQLSNYICARDWIFGTEELKIAVSTDGKSYTEVASQKYEEPKDLHVEEVLDMELTFDPVKARYVKFIVLKTQELPEWHNGAGKPAFVFLDEFKVY